MKLKVKATKTDYLFSKVTKNWNDMLNKTKQKKREKDLYIERGTY